MSLARRQRPLFLGLAFGLAAALVLRWLMDPVSWFSSDLGRVYVIGTCSYSKVAVDLLRESPDAPFVPLALPAESPEFEAQVCDLAQERLRRGGAWWLALLPRAHVCARLRDLAVRGFQEGTPAQGYPTWVRADGEVALGVDPRQIAELGLTPTPAIVRFWVEGGYERAMVESLGFVVPEGVVQGPRVASPDAAASPST